MISDITLRFIDACRHILKEGLASNNKDLAMKLGTSPQMLTEINKGRSNIGLVAIQNIVNNFQVNSSWLITGNGKMFCHEKSMPDFYPEGIIRLNVGESDKISGIAASEEPAGNNIPALMQDLGLPLIPACKLRAFLKSTNDGSPKSIYQRYRIPDFASRGAEFLIRMEDNSMSPAYGNGDLLACKNVSGSNFIQWGKTHVIDTAQGVMIKRLFDCEDNKDAIACTSDNPRFPRFLLHLEDIISISMVVGSIKFE